MDAITLDHVISAYPDTVTEDAVYHDANGCEVIRWTVAFIPSLGLAVVPGIVGTLCYRAESLEEALDRPDTPEGAHLKMAAVMTGWDR